MVGPSGSAPFRDEVEMIALGRVVVPDLSSPRKRESRFRHAQLDARVGGMTGSGLAQLQCATRPRLPASKGRPPLVAGGAARPDGAEFSIGIPRAKTAKRKGSYVPENKQSREIIDPNHIRIPMTYGRTSETLRFAGRNISFVFVAFRPPRGPNRTRPSLVLVLGR
jgi:hypothetical protein